MKYIDFSIMQQNGMVEYPDGECPHGYPEDIDCPNCIEDKYNDEIIALEEELNNRDELLLKIKDFLFGLSNSTKAIGLWEEIEEILPEDEREL